MAERAASFRWPCKELYGRGTVTAVPSLAAIIEGFCTITLSNSGETNLDNLMLLCTRHHTLVHEGGFRIGKDFQDRWIFLRPDGIAVLECGYGSKDMIDEDFSEVVDIPPAGGLLSRGENKVFEPPPPAYLH